MKDTISNLVERDTTSNLVERDTTSNLVERDTTKDTTTETKDTIIACREEFVHSYQKSKVEQGSNNYKGNKNTEDIDLCAFMENYYLTKINIYKKEWEGGFTDGTIIKNKIEKICEEFKEINRKISVINEKLNYKMKKVEEENFVIISENIKLKRRNKELMEKKEINSWRDYL